MNNPAAGDNTQMVLDKVIDAIVKQKELPRDAITKDSNFEDLGLDSLDATEILFELEDELDVDIPNEAAREMKDVGMVVDGLVRLMAGETIDIPERKPATTDASED